MKQMGSIRENALRKSTTYTRVNFNGKKYKVNKDRLGKVAMSASLTLMLLLVAVKAAPTIHNKIEHNFEVRNIKLEECLETKEMFIENGLNISADANGNWNNDYGKIENLSEDDLYGIYHYAGYEEAAKALAELGYNSWTQFLKFNGYTYDGQPSMEVWENYAEAELIEAKNNAERMKLVGESEDVDYGRTM